MAHIGQEFRLDGGGGYRRIPRGGEFGLQGLAPRHVAHRVLELHEPPGRIENRPWIGLQPYVLAILATGAVLELDRRGVGTALRQVRQPRYGGLEFIGLDEDGGGQADQVLVRIAEHALHRRRDIGEPGVGVIAGDDVVGVFGQQPIVGFLLSQGQFRRFLRGDVPKDADRLNRHSMTIAQDGRVTLHPDISAIFGPEAILALDRAIRRAAAEIVRHRYRHHRQILRVQEGAQFGADDLLRQISKVAARLRNLQRHATTIKADYQIRGVFQQIAGPLFAGAEGLVGKLQGGDILKDTRQS